MQLGPVTEWLQHSQTLEYQSNASAIGACSGAMLLSILE